MATDKHTRRNRVGGSAEEVPSLGVLEGDILKLLWDAGESQSSVEVYEAMHFARRAEKREMQSPSTIAVTLSRMVEKGLLTVERRPTKGGKGYYSPTKPQATIVVQLLNDVCCRLAGQPLGYVLSQWHASQQAGADTEGLLADESIAEVVHALKRFERKDNRLRPKVKVPQY